MNIKKLALLVLIVLVGVLTGCSKVKDNVIVDNISLITESTVTNKTVDYQFTKTTLALYSLEKDLGTDYIEMEEFIGLIQPAIMKLNFEYNEGLTLESKVTSNDIIYDMSIKLDATSNKITFSNFNVLRYLAIIPEEYLSSDFLITSSETSLTDPSVTIDLDDYEFDIAESDGKYYMPLFLANLFFTGDVINIYSDNRELYIIEDLDDITDILSEELGENMDEEKIVKDSTNYLALLLDYFHGSNPSFTGTYKDNMEKQDLYEKTTLVDFGENVFKYTQSLTDIGTYFYDYGYSQDLMHFPSISPSSHLGEWIIRTGEYACAYTGDAIKLEETDNFYVLTVYDFALDTASLLEDLLIDIDPSKDIYIDVSCASFGQTNEIYSLLAYMTKDTFEVNYINSETKEETAVFMKSSMDLKLDNTFYVYTSEVTHGAGTIFASIVKENNLAILMGNTTEGGSAPMRYTVLPNNMILVYSSSLVYTDSDYKDIDNGVRPNHIFDCSDKIYGVIEAFDERISEELDYTIENSNTKDEINFTLTGTKENDDIELLGYKVEVIDVTYKTETTIYTNDTFTTKSEPGCDVTYSTTGKDEETQYITTVVCFVGNKTVVEEYSTSDDSFAFHYDISNIEASLVQVTALVVSRGDTMKRVVEEYAYDDFADVIDPKQEATEINVEVNAHKHSEEDIDYIKLLITEKSAVTIRLNGSLSVLTDVYDAEGKKVDNGITWTLEPGTYYIKVYLNQLPLGDYTYQINVTDSIE